MSTRQDFIFILIAVLLFSVNYSYAQDNILTEIKNISPEEIAVEGFRLNNDQEVEINAVGFRGGRRSEYMFTRAWILNTQTREVVWELEDAKSQRKSRTLLEYQDKLNLPKGEYEVYYATFPAFSFNKVDGLGHFIERIFDEIFDGDDYDQLYEEFKEDLREFNLVIRGKGERFQEGEVDEIHSVFNNSAFISMTGLRDDEYIKQGFRLERPLEVQIYAVGEVRKDGTFDYGWILNAQTREKVWKMTYRNSDHAGGANKNRMEKETLSLPAGKYVASFVTDDSHSSRQWNSAPPYDPMFWGMTLRVEEPSMKKYIDLFDYEDMPEKNVIVKFDRLRDNEFQSEGFTIKRPMNLRIYALGEGRNGDMFDYGWIVNVKTHKKVWVMDYYDTEHAGGGEKNRLFDEVQHFDKGSYMVNFVTDDAHSYWDWNTSPPIDQDNWGITLSCVDEDFKENNVTKYDEKEDKSILAQLVRMRDHDRERAHFKLKKNSDIRIYAVGEGRDGSMYDYGWIEDAEDGKVVWEMMYRRTEHAGGTKKNRLFDDTIFLKKGEYVVYYETDDSHSFNDWNSDPPYDPINWGITIYLVE